MPPTRKQMINGHILCGLILSQWQDEMLEQTSLIRPLTIGFRAEPGQQSEASGTPQMVSGICKTQDAPVEKKQENGSMRKHTRASSDLRDISPQTTQEHVNSFSSHVNMIFVVDSGILMELSYTFFFPLIQ